MLFWSRRTAKCVEFRTNSTHYFISPLILLFSYDRQSKPHCSSFPHITLYINFPAVILYDLSADGKTEPCAALIPAAEPVKDMGQDLRRYTVAGIGYLQA